MRVNELIEKRKKAFEDAKEFVKTHENENGVLSAEDKATYEKMEIEIAKISDAIEREKRAESMEKELSKAVTTPIVEKPEDSKPVEVKDTKPVKVTALTEYKEEVLRALRSRKPIVSNYLQEGIDASGGYLVPEEMDREIIKKLAEENVFRKLAKTINTSGEYKINIAADKPTAAWIEEGESLVFSDPTFNQIKLDAHKLSVAVKVTEELLADNAFDLEGYLIEEFSRALANAEEDAFLNGVGDNKPHGIFHETDGGEIAVELNNAQIKFDDIFTLVYSLKRPYRKKARFIMNDQTIAILRKVKDNNGAYIWQPSVQAGEPDKILGYPVETSAYCPMAEAGKPCIAFGDFSYYKIGERGQRSFQELKELYAGNGMIAFVAKERVDGKLALREAVQILKIKDNAGGTVTP